MELLTGNRAGPADFFRDVAKYFMDFLETDFHKHRAPRRASSSRNSDNLLIGVNLNKYGAFRKVICRSLVDGLPTDPPLKVRQDQYRTQLPAKVADLVQLQVSRLDAAEIAGVLEQAAIGLRNQAALNPNELDVALVELNEQVGTALFETLTHPFVESIASPLRNAELGDADDIFRIEQELTAVLLAMVDSKLAEMLTRSVSGEPINVLDELAPLFNLGSVQSTLSGYFGSLRIADLYLEVAELARNGSILDKQDLYLYFGEIGFRGNRYPIFYMPLQVEKVEDAFHLEFDSQVYINKKALEFVVQEVNVANDTHGTLREIGDRIIYTAAYGKDLISRLQGIVTEIITHFELPGNVDLTDTADSSARSSQVVVSNSISLALFDKSDEALVNDYEEILQELALDGGSLSEAFNRILADFLQKNPEPVGPIVEDMWDDLSTSDKLVTASPIPLNSEQQQILAAVHEDACKYLIVEGPPGTGKSHTITAIIFDAVLNDQSVLVLSDKKEALDVVEKNITETINKVRFDQNFQNPILRLGKTGSTYSQILSKSSITDIKTHHRAVKQQIASIADAISGSVEELKQDIELESLGYQDLDLSEIQELVSLEEQVDFERILFDLQEVLHDADGPMAMGELRSGLQEIQRLQRTTDYTRIEEAIGRQPQTLTEVAALVRQLRVLDELGARAREMFGTGIEALNLFTAVQENDLPQIVRRASDYSAIKQSLFGGLFSKGKLRDLDQRSAQELALRVPLLSVELPRLNVAKRVLEFLNTEIAKQPNGPAPTPDRLRLTHLLLTDSGFLTSARALTVSADVIEQLPEYLRQFPKSVKRMQLEGKDLSAIWRSSLLTMAEADFERDVRFAQLQQNVTKGFTSVSDVDFGARKQRIEGLVTAQVAHKLDGQVINFYEGSRNDAEMLRNVIKSKQKFPRAQFDQLRVAFPCILAGIRDFAEYIPLQNATFDLLIIDEASQVSLAQAFPALLRAKKVLILGDRKQFSNVKAAQARSDTNREYLYGLDRSFRKNVSADVAQLTRLGKFNIKTSVLEFFEFISNYNMQLVKHFRGYKEIISYSNKYFYNNSLQVMKIRAKHIDEVIKFSYVEAQPDDEVYPNANLQEVRFIRDELLGMLKRGDRSSVGIITPHTNQQKLLVEQLGKLPEFPRMLTDLHLKVMTFDTCQGEERDIIFYSMVASRHSDKLWGVFIKDLASVDIEEDGQIKAQRLNVGFSRGKEQLHFVLSKPLDEFSGSAGEALRHFANELEQAKRERSVAEVDQNSPKEAEVLNWFYQTNFWQKNKERITFVPQFEIGKYLKQLDITYTHPMYKVDFLVAVQDSRGKERKIVMEYDGFYEHFKNHDLVNAYNYQSYMSDDDVYREKVLESYGYRFLRINRFNVGEDPVATLDRRLTDMMKVDDVQNPLLFKIHDTIDGLNSGDTKECPKCRELRSADEFHDATLPSGRGRICRYCKTLKPQAGLKASKSARNPSTSSKRTCPKCGSKLVRRSGRYGEFYGCSRYPYCKGTRRSE